MDATALIIAIGVVCFLLLYFAFNLKEQHFLMQLMALFFFVFLCTVVNTWGSKPGSIMGEPSLTFSLNSDITLPSAGALQAPLRFSSSSHNARVAGGQWAMASAHVGSRPCMALNRIWYGRDCWLCGSVGACTTMQNLQLPGGPGNINTGIKISL